VRAGVSVAEVMRDKVVAVRERARFAEIAAAMQRFHISSLPVIDSQDRVIGLISNYDLLLGDGVPQSGRSRLLGRFRHRDRCESAGMLATELMSSPAVTVTALTPARDAAREMYRHRIHQLPVVDAMTGRLTGVITRSDLLAVYERPDEDIRGEILNGIIEHTLGMPPGRFEVAVVSGAVTIRGHLERRSAALRLAEAIAHVDGVITVIDHLTFACEDTTPKMPRARL
jgi:CBS-domain-containing membrane protein